MKSQFDIPFNKPFIIGNELRYIRQAVENGQLSGNGPFTRQCQEWLKTNLMCHEAFHTHSCTGALEMAAIILDLKPGDEVIMPSFTFVSTANAFVLRGAVPVFIDVRPDTLCIDKDLINEAVSPKTKGVVPVHYAGIACSMDQIMGIANQRKLWVVEDAAQALLSFLKEKHLGTIGHLGCLSFHETKNIISGEGGALIVNDPALCERAEIIWEKGTNRRKFFEGDVDKYTWVEIGSSFQPSEIVSAFLFAQFEEARKITDKRCQLYNMYYRLLEPLSEKELIELPYVEKQGHHNGHMFYLISRSKKERDELITFLKRNNILAVFHYVPLHYSQAGKKYGVVRGRMNVTKKISDCLIRLPLYYEMNSTDVEKVADTIKAFYNKC